jgi:4'-phosphopantetheinyl transferase
MELTAGDAIELWLVDLERCAGPLKVVEQAVPRLVADDRRRAGSTRHPRERRHRLAVYTALRILLERTAGAGARGQAIVRAPGSRPHLERGGAEFSLSHIDGFALIGVSPALPLGVDLESARPVTMALHRVDGIVAAGAGLGSKPLPALGLERTFLQAWTRLEAFTKARGRELALTLADVGVRGTRASAGRLSPRDIEARARQVAREAGVVAHDLTLPAALHGAVAAPRGARPGRVRLFPPDRAKIELLVDLPGRPSRSASAG